MSTARRDQRMAAGPATRCRPYSLRTRRYCEYIRFNDDVDEQSSSEHSFQQKSYTMDHASSGLPRKIPYHLLEEITGGFSDVHKLGSGAFGNVFMGVHNNGDKIAIKLLRDGIEIENDEEQFLNEFKNLASLHHPNVVQLVGYCHERQGRFVVPYKGGYVIASKIHRALCMEYMHCGSLDKYLFDEDHGLDWSTRYTLIKGICNGLKYLHEESKPPIYHLDLKPANILLDEKMLPKIADFGLSRFFGEEQTKITQSSVGTRGYLPPEYIERNKISSKFDIWSLGVVIIQMMTGHTGYTKCWEMSSPQEFIELAHENWRIRLQETPEHVFESYSKQVKRCLEIALSCVETDRRKRPSIGDIVKQLNETEILIQKSSQLPGRLRSYQGPSTYQGMSTTKVNKRVGKYELGRIIGEGTFTKVRFARNVETGKPVAIKILDKEKVLKHKMVEQIKREISMMKLIEHPNVVRIYEVMGSKTKIYIVLEYATDGGLFETIVTHGRVSECDSRRYFQQLINVVDYCHSRGVYHRNIKHKKLLLDPYGNLKVSGFGLSTLAQQVEKDGLLHTTCGTPNYVAPEVLDDQGYDGAMADLWSCGVILFVLLAGYLPFEDSNLMTLYKKISNAEFTFPPWISSPAKRLLTRILDPNPMMRITIPEILEDEWFKKDYKRPEFNEKYNTTLLDDVDAVFNDSEEHHVTEKKEPIALNAFELISLSEGLNLGNFFDTKEMVHALSVMSELKPFLALPMTIFLISPTSPPVRNQ